MSDVQIAPATQQDLETLIATDTSPASREHLRQRWARQSRDEALFLLARREGTIVGHGLLLRESKYPAVRTSSYRPAEINALTAYVRRTGVGTAIIAAAEAVVRQWGREWIGLAVEPNNPARRLYERLGYREWDGGSVVDEWTEQDENGAVVRSHADRCTYLLKPLSA